MDQFIYYFFFGCIVTDVRFSIYWKYLDVNMEITTRLNCIEVLKTELHVLVIMFVVTYWQ